MTDGDSPQGERLQKVLAARGWGSRRVCEEMIESGRVRVNGETAVLGRRVDVERDVVEVDGAPVGIRPDLVYYLLNKPAGVVSTAKDTHDRETVVDLVPAEPRVYPVGRLDAETEGLLLLTNDGELTFRLTHPKFGVEKEYVAQVESDGRPVSREALAALRKGVDIGEGVTSPAEVGELQPGVLRIVIHEGRNRQVRRMCETVGYPVVRLVRTRIGPLVDKSLRPGEWRSLNLDEVRSLIEAVAGEPSDTL
ncbi:MAG: pseudouridine synthase RluB [Actinomycetota bacterium]